MLLSCNLGNSDSVFIREGRTDLCIWCLWCNIFHNSAGLYEWKVALARTSAYVAKGLGYIFFWVLVYLIVSMRNYDMWTFIYKLNNPFASLWQLCRRSTITAGLASLLACRLSVATWIF